MNTILVDIILAMATTCHAHEQTAGKAQKTVPEEKYRKVPEGIPGVAGLRMEPTPWMSAPACDINRPDAYRSLDLGGSDE